MSAAANYKNPIRFLYSSPVNHNHQTKNTAVRVVVRPIASKSWIRFRRGLMQTCPLATHSSILITILIVRQLRRLLAWVRDVGFTAREQGAPHSVAIVDDLRLEYFPSQLSLALLLFAP
ncbi:hypothetical protein BHE74_00028196 [Ensete ventricosum]|nr:hypothetical protein BHE74_00028196 [Ensete ventricosum]